MHYHTLVAAVLVSGHQVVPAPDAQNLARWREYLSPSKEELAWQQVPWRASFWSGVVAAQELDKPVLLWAMNGHPLACT